MLTDLQSTNPKYKILILEKDFPFVTYTKTNVIKVNDIQSTNEKYKALILCISNQLDQITIK